MYSCTNRTIVNVSRPSYSYLSRIAVWRPLLEPPLPPRGVVGRPNAPPRAQTARILGTYYTYIAHTFFSPMLHRACISHPVELLPPRAHATPNEAPSFNYTIHVLLILSAYVRACCWTGLDWTGLHPTPPHSTPPPRPPPPPPPQFREVAVEGDRAFVQLGRQELEERVRSLEASVEEERALQAKALRKAIAERDALKSQVDRFG